LEDPADDPYATLAQLAAPSGASLVRHGDAFISEVLDDLAQTIEDIDGGATYVLPAASPNVLGGIKLGANLTVDAGGVVTAGLTNGAIVSALVSAAVAPRTHTFPNKSGTVAHLDDVVAAGAMVLLGQATVSAAVANIDFLSIFSSAYDKYVIDINDVRASTADILMLRLAVANAVVTTTDYLSGPEGSSLAGTAGYQINSLSLRPGFGITASINIQNSSGTATSVVKAISATGVYLEDGVTYRAILRAGGVKNVGVLTGFRLFWSAGSNFTAGTVRVYGIKNS
jgi:hypothetical protein